MKNLGMFFGCVCIGVASAWVTATVIESRVPAPVEELVVPEDIQTVAVTVDPTKEPDELTLGTGDTFWGLHFDGMLPCSRMLVRGGGYIVNFSDIDNPTYRAHFHVDGKKTVSVYGQEFTVEVTGEDEIHVVRTPEKTVVAAVGD